MKSKPDRWCAKCGRQLVWRDYRDTRFMECPVWSSVIVALFARAWSAAGHSMIAVGPIKPVFDTKTGQRL